MTRFNREEWSAWHADMALGKDKAWAPTNVMFHLELAEQEIDRLRAELDAAQLRSIEARNPGIDMDEVRRSRARGGIEVNSVVAMWSPCCKMLRAGDHWSEGSMHDGGCRNRHGGILGPAVRLVVHPVDKDALEAALGRDSQ